MVFIIEIMLFYSLIYYGFYRSVILVKMELDEIKHDTSYADNDEIPPPYTSPQNPLCEP